MASEQLKHDELIEPGLFDPAISNAKEMLQVTNELTVAFTKLAKVSGKKIAAGPSFGSVEEVKQFQTELKKVDDIEKGYNETIKKKAALEKEIIELEKKKSEAKKKKNAATSEEIKDEIRYNNVVKSQKKDLQDLIRFQTAQKGSIDQLRARLSIVTKQYNALSAAERDNTNAGKALLAEQKQITDQLNRMEQAGGNFRRQVGNYEVAYKKFGKGIKGVTGVLVELAAAFGINTEAIQGLADAGSAAFGAADTFENLKDIKNGVVANTEAITEQVAATEAQVLATEAQAVATGELAAAEVTQTAATEGATVAQEEFNAAASANPIGVVILAIVALAAALYGLNKYLTSSSDETKKLERANEALQKSIEKQKVTIQARLTVLESELDVLKAQGAPLEEIRKKQAEINQEKERELLLNIEGIKSSIALNKQKIADVAANDSLWESYLKAAAAVQRFLGNEKEAERTELVIALNKRERAEEFQKSLEEQQASLEQAEADYQAFLNSLLVQQAEYDKEDADFAKKQTERIKEHNKHRADLYKQDRDAKIQAEQDKINRLLALRARLEALEADITPLTERQVETKRYMDQLEELNDIAERARAEGRFNQERYDRDLELIEQKHYNRMEEIRDSEIDQEIDDEKAKQDEITRIEKEAEDARIAALKERIEEQIAIEEKLLSAYRQSLDERNKLQDLSMDQQLKEINDNISVQQDQFNQGLDNTLAYEKKRREEALAEQRTMARKRHDEQIAMDIAELFIELQKEYADEGLGGSVRAFSEAMAAKGIAMAIAGSFKEGTEDTGNFQGPGVDGQGGRYAIIHKRERILPEELNTQLDGISNKELVANALAFDQLKTELAGSVLPESVVREQGHDMVASMILNGLMSLEKTVKNKTEYSLKYSDLRQIVEEIVKNGERKKIIHNLASGSI